MKMRVCEMNNNSYNINNLNTTFSHAPNLIYFNEI